MVDAQQAQAAAQQAQIDQLAAVVIALQTIVTNQAATAAAAAAAPPVLPAPPAPLALPTRIPVYDLFDSGIAFDMSSRAGSSAMTQAASALPKKWNGSVNELPGFLIALKTRAMQVKWDAAAPNGILTYGSHNLLTAHHSVSLTDIETERVARELPANNRHRAIQNARAMFQCLAASVEGNLQLLIFGQDGNLPSHQDGPTLFKTLLETSAAATIQVSMTALKDLQNLDPAEFGFDIVRMNTKASTLFEIATTSARTLADAERVQLILTAYNRIRQPSEWSNWVASKIDAVEEGLLVPPAGVQAHRFLMNKAAYKAHKMSIDDTTTYSWKSSTLGEDVIAMMAAQPPHKKRGVTKPPPKSTENKANTGTTKTDEAPTFIRHFKRPESEGGTAYAVGDTKQVGSVTWNFCGCPNHKNGRKWHTFPISECRTRKNWLEQGGEATANTADDEAAPGDALTGDASTGASPEVLALLGNALSMVADRDDVCDVIGEVLQALSQA